MHLGHHCPPGDLSFSLFNTVNGPFIEGGGIGVGGQAMGRAGKWLRGFLTGKKEKDKEKKDDRDKSSSQAAAPPREDKPSPISTTTPPPKEKRRWSFRRSAGGGKDMNNSPEPTAHGPLHAAAQESEMDHKRHAMAMAAATAAAAGAAVAAAQAAATVVRLTTCAPARSGAIEEAAAVKIQSLYRAYLARKALRALKGLVKLQALVRGHLVRKQATATLRCMQALVTAQARARVQRMRMAEDAHTTLQRQSTHRRSPLDPRYRQSYDMERSPEEEIKIVEMDLGESKGSSTKSRSSYSVAQTERSDHRLSSSYYGGSRAHPTPDFHHQISPAPSALTEMSPRACSGHFEELFSFATAQSSPHYLSAVSHLDPGRAPAPLGGVGGGGTPREEYAYSMMANDYPLFPNYMANTESSRAKARSQSAPKQRPETPCERQPSRRRPSIEGRNIPRGVRMQRSSSHVGSAVSGGYQYYPWSMKLDRSSMSLKDSECGSSSTVLTNTNYCRSLVSYEVSRDRSLMSIAHQLGAL